MALPPSTACCEIASPAPRGTQMRSRHAFDDCPCLISGGARCFADAADACGVRQHRGVIWQKAAAERADAQRRIAHARRRPRVLPLCIFEFLCVFLYLILKRTIERGQSCAHKDILCLDFSDQKLYIQIQIMLLFIISEQKCTSIVRPPRRDPSEHVRIGFLCTWTVCV